MLPANLRDNTSGPLRWVIGQVIAVTITVTAAFSQSTGSIQGAVVGDSGKPISGARVYAALKSTSQQVKAPPTIVTKAGNAVNAAPDGTFTIPNLSAGPYVLCVQTTVSGWLDPCQWSSSISLVALAAGQSLTAQKVVMTTGAILQIRINDPAKFLPPSPGAIANDVEVLALASNKVYYRARIVSTDAGGRNHELTLPFNAQHTLIVRSQQFTLTDSKGAAVPAAGHTEPVQAATGAPSQQFTFTVTGKSN
jgi:hypothetical protein